MDETGEFEAMTHVMGHMMQLLVPIVIVMVVGQVLLAFAKRGSRVYVPAPTPAAAPALPSTSELWKEAAQIADTLAKQLAEWEFDPEQRYFQRPALADSSEPLTADWLDAKAAMDAALPERRPADRDKAQAALDAARRARKAWDAAWHYAGGIGLGTLDVRDRRRMKQAQKILAQAADQATTEAERAACIDRVVTILSEVTAVDRTSIRRSIATHVSAQLAIPAKASRIAIAAAKSDGRGSGGR